MEIRTSVLGFLSARLLDREAGGAFTATDVTGRRPLCRDKRLVDQAAAVFALAEHEHEDLGVALTGLHRLLDPHGQPGFVEVTDRYWRVLPAGRTRTLRLQLLASTALLTAAHRRDDDELRVHAVDLLNRCLSTARDGRLPEAVTEDWRAVRGNPSSPRAGAAAVRALAVADLLGESDVDTAVLPLVADRLRELAEVPRPEHLTDCAGLTRTAIALAHAGRLLARTADLAVAQRVLRSAVDNFHDPELGGFWDRRPCPGAVLPPVKRTADAADLLLAGRLVRSCGLDDHGVARLAESALRELADEDNGGFYAGVGYHWATPSDPVAPAVQQLLPAPAGSAAHGGDDRGSLPLHRKTTLVHARLARVARDAPARPTRERGEDRKRPSHLAGALPGDGAACPVPTVPRVDPTVALPVDRERHLNAIRSGARRIRRVSAAYRLIADTWLLARGLPRSWPPVALVCAAQNGDGGFGECPGQDSDVASTHGGVVGLLLAGALGQLSPAVADYLHACRRPDGGFGAVPGMRSDVSHTHLAVAALHALGLDGRWPTDGCAAFLASCRVGSGGFGARPGHPANTLATRRAVATLRLLGAEIPDRQGLVHWLRACETGTGAFAHRPGHAASTLGTCHALAALALLDAPEGPTGRSPEGDPGAVEDGFHYLQSVAVRNGAVGQDWIALIS
ncbi:prenyltransferase/squalene oxidase repeat-containing protein [Actinophytocola xanthii]|uniref:Geranylgeranyl transferase type II subunit beta n=1 Tax=Actinophytocola xanthii TaxID=1912961 RepID=A0A1Q8C5H0_9PSEU|nr:prenyltransferase/squalene oxidase repeat-containing protein [Actinophytocola xanthii]OLF09589.1 hypothetical protein BU204_33005 [Actinophytocola xanthii]